MRWVTTRVFPLPGPARTRSGPQAMPPLAGSTDGLMSIYPFNSPAFDFQKLVSLAFSTDRDIIYSILNHLS